MCIHSSLRKLIGDVLAFYASSSIVSKKVGHHTSTQSYPMFKSGQHRYSDSTWLPPYRPSIARLSKLSARAAVTPTQFTIARERGFIDILDCVASVRNLRSPFFI